MWRNVFSKIAFSCVNIETFGPVFFSNLLLLYLLGGAELKINFGVIIIKLSTQKSRGPHFGRPWEQFVQCGGPSRPQFQ